MRNEFNRKLVLEDGSEYPGYAFGADAEVICEVVFNTSMVGYQEILSDPSYTDQAVVMSYPLIGNYGMAADDYETETPSIGALIVREYNDSPSNFRSEKTLSEVMKQYHIPGLCGIDTRKLVRQIRSKGACPGILTDIGVSKEEALKRLKAFTQPKDAVSRVTCKETKRYRAENAKLHVAAIDCGMKQNIVRSFLKRGCDVTVVPFHIGYEELKALKPDGIFISNGPGNPTDVEPVIALLKKLRGEYPMFGICLGHQMICLAYGAKTYKLKFGHRGGNHPVLNRKTGKIEITSQNHSYAVDADSVKETDLTITHINLLDETVEGVECMQEKVFSVQYHPESAPGPQDSTYLFERFINWMEEKDRA